MRRRPVAGQQVQSHAAHDGRVGGRTESPMTDLFGLVARPASRSAPLAPSVAARMSATYGLRSSTSSASAALQQSLASRLQEALASHGTTMFTLTWKTQVTPLRRPICALLASALRTSGNGCTGWPTAISNDATGSTHCYSRGDKTKKALKLPGAALLASWATPAARDWHSARGSQEFLSQRTSQARGKPLSEQAYTLTLGKMSNGSNAATEKPGQLNPEFPRWLQGYPKEWCEAAIMAHRSMRTTRRKPE